MPSGKLISRRTITSEFEKFQVDIQMLFITLPGARRTSFSPSVRVMLADPARRIVTVTCQTVLARQNAVQNVRQATCSRVRPLSRLHDGKRVHGDAVKITWGIYHLAAC